uniref:bestrophin family protein n=1 Tax=Pedobacter namyangjuensis TaxID=600626 RepID=UPI000DE34F5C
MLLINNIRLSRIVRNTWQVDLIMIASCMGAYFIREYLIAHHFSIPTIIPTVLGTAIAFFIGFNNNQAYDRWWEARKVWGGLVNDSRSFARSLLSYVPQSEANDVIVKRMIRRHIAFLYALKGALWGVADTNYPKYLDDAEWKYVDKQSNKHNAILHKQSDDLELLSKTNQVDGFRFIQINEMLVRFSDEMGMSERIKNTVFPTTYSYL